MDNEVFSQDINEEENDWKPSINAKSYKLNFSVIRTLTCSIILIILALLKCFNYASYQKVGEFYNNIFKIESLSSITIKDFTFDKLKLMQNKIKDKIGNL